MSVNPYDSPKQSSDTTGATDKVKTIGLVLLVFGFLNFALFVIGSLILGGDAVNGKVDDGQYFLGGKSVSVEVSKAIWIYSYIHVVSVWITHPLAMIGGILFVGNSYRRKSAGRPISHIR